MDRSGPELAKEVVTNAKSYLAKWPKVEALPDEYGFRLSGRYMSPRNGGGSDSGFGTLFTLIFIGFGIYYYYYFTHDNTQNITNEEWAITIIGSAVIGLILGYILFRLYLWFYAKKLDVIITPYDIGVARRFKYEVITRPSFFEFTVEDHQNSRKEQEREIENPHKKENRKRVFRKSVEVTIRYGARRIVLADIFDNFSKAEKLHASLVYLDDRVNEYKGA